MRPFNQHRMKELAILLFLILNSITNLNAQCVIDFPARDTFPCVVPVDSFPKVTMADIMPMGGGDCDVVSIELIQPLETEAFHCTSNPIYYKYYRRWMINAGINSFEFKDTICLTRIDISDITFPGDTIIDCSLGDTTESSAGYPMIDSFPIVENHIQCNLWIGVSTSIPYLGCPNSYKLKRNWLIMDKCDNSLVIDTCQTIEITDSTDPVITLMTPIEECIETDKCAADITFPPPASLFDNCTDSADITITINVFSKVGDPFFMATSDSEGRVFDVPPGHYDVEYVADDGCSNLGRAMAELKVEDKTPPLAQGRDMELQFNGGVSMMTIPATQFDNGSRDLCELYNVFFKVKRLNAPVGFTCANTGNPDNKFDDNIKFCCEDVGTPVMVLLRVYDKIVPLGTVEDDLRPNNHADFMLMVTVLDKSPPVIDCPDADTIDCSDDLLDLSYIPTPGFTDNCSGATIKLDTTIYDLNECNVGCIIRRWVAMDASGLTDTCNHKIFVRDRNPFDGTDTTYLKWPENVVLKTCNAATDTANTGSPRINLKNSCGQIAFRYSDELYQYVENACYKILRTWKVFDWCQFDGSEYNPYGSSSGFWHFTQVIKVMDTVPPVLGPLADLTVGTESLLCGPALATIPVFSATDCTMPTDLQFTYKVDLGNDGGYEDEGTGKDASGMYPLGTHKIHVFVNDGCGNRSDGTFLLTVQDLKPPSAIFNGSLVAELMAMNGGGMVEVPARLFKSKSEDNCSPVHMLRYAYSANVDDSVRIFTCADLGINPVTIYVFDEAGNFDFTTNTLEIQDNMGVCVNTVFTGEQKTTVQGLIKTEKDLPVERVSITMLQGTNNVPTTTNRRGKFVFDQVAMHQDYQIVPKKEINPLNGISTLDIVRITKHVLGSKPFESPYQIIASDINQNGSVTTLDVVHLRKLILGIIPHFRDNKSWEFIDASYEFINPLSPFEEAYPTLYNIQDLTDQMNIEFIGVKLGDVNYSVEPNRFAQASVRNDQLKSNLFVQQVKDGDFIKLNFYLKDLTDFQGIQFALNILNQAHSLQINMDGLLGAEHVYFHEDFKQLRVSWNPQTEMNITSSKLFSIQFEQTRTTDDVAEWIKLEKHNFSSEIYTNNQINQVVLVEDSRTSANDYFGLQQNEPNPFNNVTKIAFSLPKDQNVNFNIYNLEGRLVHTRQMSLLKGKHEIELNDEHIPHNGIYIYELKSLWHTARNKMIKVN